MLQFKYFWFNPKTRNDLGKICTTFCQRFSPISKMMDFSWSHFGFIGSDFIGAYLNSFGARVWSVPISSFLRNLDMMQDDDAMTSKANASSVTTMFENVKSMKQLLGLSSGLCMIWIFCVVKMEHSQTIWFCRDNFLWPCYFEKTWLLY